MPERLLKKRWPWVAAAALIVLAVLASMVEIRDPDAWDGRPAGRAPEIRALAQRGDVNLLFILVDTLRAERLGSYGYERDTSPFIDELAASGVRFGRHLAQSSWTKASMASLWTGLYPVRNGITRYEHVLPDEALMPAEVLREAGFQTVGLYRNGWLAPKFRFDQGFEVYKRPLRNTPPIDVRRENPTISDAGTDESVVSAALEFLRAQGRERWFLYLHLMDVHEYLFDEASALFGVTYSDVYDNSIRWTDGTIEVLITSMGELGFLENTLVVFASDHGEAFGERGFEGHARKVYRETTETPLFLWFPFRLEPGLVIETRTANVDVWPTVLDLLGLEMTEVDGRSRVPEILAAAEGRPLRESESLYFAHLDQHWARPDPPLHTVAVSDGTHRLVRVEEEGGVIEQLYDAADDPRELRDRAREDPETLARLGEAARSYLARDSAYGEIPTRELSELELNHLRALGYAVP